MKGPVRPAVAGADLDGVALALQGQDLPIGDATQGAVFLVGQHVLVLGTGVDLLDAPPEMVREVRIFHGFGQVSHGLDLAGEDALAVALTVGGEIEDLDGLAHPVAQVVRQGDAAGRTELDVHDENIRQTRPRRRPDRLRVLKGPQLHVGQDACDLLLQAAQVHRLVIAEPNVVHSHLLLFCLLLLSYHRISQEANPVVIRQTPGPSPRSGPETP